MKWEPNNVEHVDTRRRGHKPDLNWLQIERELGRNLAKNQRKINRAAIVWSGHPAFLPRTPAPTATQISELEAKRGGPYTNTDTNADTNTNANTNTNTNTRTPAPAATQISNQWRLSKQWGN